MSPSKLCRFLATYFLGVGIGLVVSVLFTGCGSGPGSISKVGGPGSPTSISVELDDAWTASVPNGSEKVELQDARYFTPPASLLIVQGTYGGVSPGQNLHARLLVGGGQCEYLGNGISAQVLLLQQCSGTLSANTLLPSGSVIELVNYDCPGFLVQANFSLAL